jgi:hypothetical protein
VRGDSLRDLYAKTLALLGLGVLAGVGALMDYWPAGIDLPAAAGVPKPVVASLALPVPALPDTADAVAGATRASAHPIVVLAAYTRPAADRPDNISATTPPPDAIALSDAISAEPALHTIAPPSIPASTVSLMAPRVSHPIALDGRSTAAEASDDESLMLLASAPAAIAAEPSAESSLDDGLLAGAVKRTGTSIVKTGVKTGASIFDMMRFVGGAVRRALPN